MGGCPFRPVQDVFVWTLHLLSLPSSRLTEGAITLKVYCSQCKASSNYSCWLEGWKEIASQNSMQRSFHLVSFVPSKVQLLGTMKQSGDTTLASPPQCTVIFYEPPGLLILGVAVTAGLLCVFPPLMVSAMGGFHCSAWLRPKGKQGYILACCACHWSQCSGSDWLWTIPVTLTSHCPQLSFWKASRPGEYSLCPVYSLQERNKKHILLGDNYPVLGQV